MVSHDLEMLGILYTHLGRIASDQQILEVEGGWTWVDPLKPISLLNALISNRGGSWRMLYQLRGRYILIFFSVFSRCLVLIGETYLLNSGHFFGFFLVNFELIQHSPSIATSRTWLKPVVCKSWTQIALVLTLTSWNITEPLEGRPTKQGD